MLVETYWENGYEIPYSNWIWVRGRWQDDPAYFAGIIFSIYQNPNSKLNVIHQSLAEQNIFVNFRKVIGTGVTTIFEWNPTFSKHSQTILGQKKKKNFCIIQEMLLWKSNYQLGMSMYMLARNASFGALTNRFQRSPETVHRQLWPYFEVHVIHGSIIQEFLPSSFYISISNKVLFLAQLSSGNRWDSCPSHNNG